VTVVMVVAVVVIVMIVRHRGLCLTDCHGDQCDTK